MDGQRVDDKPNFLTWATFPALISGVAVIAYAISCSYVLSIYVTFDFQVWDYLDLIDYVQFLPQNFWGITLVLASLFLLCVYSYVKIIAKYSKKLRISKVARWRRRLNALSRMYTPVWNFVIASCLLAFLPAFILGRTLFFSGLSLREEMGTKNTSQIFRKGQPCPAEGKILLHSSRYILILENDLITAIPHTEVQMITTRVLGQRPSNHASSSASPAAPATSSTSPEPK
jgi:hypothetical protein